MIEQRVPTGDEQLTVSNTADTLSPPAGYQGARMYVDTNGVRIRFDAVPTALIGLALADEYIDLSRDEIDTIQLIRSSGTDSEVFVAYWQ